MTQNTYVALLKDQVVGSSVASVTLSLSGISGYKDLVIVVDSVQDSGTYSNYIEYNGNTSGYDRIVFYGPSSVGYQTNTAAGYVGAWSTTATGRQVAVINIFDITGANYKYAIGRYSHGPSGTPLPEQGLAGVLWKNTAAITSIKLSGNYAAGTTISLYGIAKNIQESSTYATGGDVYEDATYWYHAFPYSGTFVNSATISADVLVVAGGGGASGFGGGGGGAGGLIYGTRSLTAGSRSITVGAGGRSALFNGDNGVQGADSVFSVGNTPWTAIGGGAGAHNVTGGNGGSGGGGGYGSTGGGTKTQTSPAGATGYGFNGGGNNGQGAPNYPGGGGGGAGGTGGEQSTASNSGSGGVGRTDANLNAFGLATGTGELSGGNYYYAGGGGGSAINAAGNLGGLGGGGLGVWYLSENQQLNYMAIDGSVSTGGGGGGGGINLPYRVAGNGGSGIVIVRYAK